MNLWPDATRMAFELKAAPLEPFDARFVNGCWRRLQTSGKLSTAQTNRLRALWKYRIAL